MLVQWQIFDKRNAVYIIEDSHQGLQINSDEHISNQQFMERSKDEDRINMHIYQLNDAPDRNDQRAQGQFWSTESHLALVRIYCNFINHKTKTDQNYKARSEKCMYVM